MMRGERGALLLSYKSSQSWTGAYTHASTHTPAQPHAHSHACTPCVQIVVITILGWPFAELKHGAQGAPGVHQDMITLLRWLWHMHLKREQPGNTAMKHLLQGLVRHSKEAAAPVRTESDRG